ncbi:hypothetical protein HHO41_01585 [Bacillus sp. DNRA2]|uniref:hypothetical protein n=1 Tax=Bacillus sp. DNRA2 TaxID=2723053 RepID=UPI00145CE303|nr:hypothetical protein [Bacillus sp. DNRA2]NMD68961.1 hypothetical protein [Bacillus sp. DNRA2]
MISRDLEFRGINRRHLELYFEELGGKRLGSEAVDSFPILFVGDGWEGHIVSEKELAFTAVFKVNAVKIRFVAEDEVALTELLKKYRYKTTRVGG